MNRELKRAWVTALRSGEIRQATNKLEDRSGAMCCLGVLCSIAIPERKGLTPPDETSTSRIGYRRITSNLVEWSVLPPDLAKAIGTTQAGEIAGLYMRWTREARDSDGELVYVPVLGDDGEEHEAPVCLATCNDSGFTFAQIADIIEYAFPEDGE